MGLALLPLAVQQTGPQTRFRPYIAHRKTHIVATHQRQCRRSIRLQRRPGLGLGDIVRVFAFEPDPRNQAALTINASTGGNVTIVPKAVAENSGKRRLDVSQNSGISHLAQEDAIEAIDIDAVTIDSYVASVPEANVRLIKIDIEGHDLNAVKGGLDTIRAHQPLILAEFAPEGLAINDPAKLFRLCRELGYGVFAFARESDYAAAVLRNMSEEDFGCIWVKMLFLVPDRLNAANLNLVSNGKTE